MSNNASSLSRKGKPCKDYSGINQRQPGRTGSQKRLFNIARIIRDEIIHQWPNQTLGRAGRLPSTVPQYGIQPVLVNAAGPRRLKHAATDPEHTHTHPGHRSRTATRLPHQGLRPTGRMTTGNLVHCPTTQADTDEGRPPRVANICLAEMAGGRTSVRTLAVSTE